jgi:hypothetical protein
VNDTIIPVLAIACIAWVACGVVLLRKVQQNRLGSADFLCFLRLVYRMRTLLRSLRKGEAGYAHPQRGSTCPAQGRMTLGQVINPTPVVPNGDAHAWQAIVVQTATVSGSTHSGCNRGVDFHEPRVC